MKCSGTATAPMVTVDGKQYKKSLMMGCLKCHTDKKKFCEQCHNLCIRETILLGLPFRTEG